MNTVSLIGNISTEIDLRFTPQGHAVCKFNLAVTNPFNREKTSFVPIEIWRKQAENTSNFCQKGSKVGVVGHIEIDQFEKDGQKRTFTKVVANSVEFLTPKNSGSQQQAPRYNADPGDPFRDSGEPAPDISDDDLPF
ncbi:single-stranded DNA-binding protein [Pseudobacillus badius]|uniref:single-stranded DNA-binding protein n=1 Tax=Bacillus badius TaxID=1455 RepID=UPI001CBF9B1E|nr:single-stranded DNA-binding protein [Bacillus badius]UAT29443.1 single-stranded DNA-binding protein [Bacillus badius]GLY11383.1 single-stranded DNA-binding protein [Bacillus badius]